MHDPAAVVRLFSQLQQTSDGEAGFGFGCDLLGLGAAQTQSVFTRQNEADSLVVDTRQRAGIDGEADFATWPCVP